MMFQANTGPNTINKAGGVVNPIGFQHLPGGDKNEQKQALNMHMSCCDMDANACPDGEILVSSEYECMHFHQKRMLQRKADSLRLGVPLLVSEFGNCYNTDACAMEINMVTEQCDDQLVGWTYWQFKTFGNDFKASNSTQPEEPTKEEPTISLFHENGEPQLKKVRALSRSYLPYTQGRLAKMNFDKISGSFIASFELNTEIKAPSVLFVSSNFQYEGMEKNVKILSSGKELTQKQVSAKWDGPYFYFEVLDQDLDKEIIEITCEPGEQSAASTFASFF